MNLKKVYAKASYQQIQEYKESLRNLLKKVCALCDEYGVKYSLDCGTLLGYWRDGDICKNDGDGDLYVLAETLTPEFIEAIKPMMRDKKGGQIMPSAEILRSFKKGSFIPPKFIQVEDRSQGFFRENNPFYPSVDMFVLVKYGAERFGKVFRTYWVRFPDEIVSDLVRFKCALGEVSVPRKTEELLRIYFGDTWKVPDDSFRDNFRSLKYAYWGLCSNEEVGSFTFNFKENLTRESTGISLKNQMALGLVDENLVPTGKSVMPYFDNWEANKQMLTPVIPAVRKRVIDDQLIMGSHAEKCHLATKYWKYMTPEQKIKYKDFYQPIFV